MNRINVLFLEVILASSLIIFLTPIKSSAILPMKVYVDPPQIVDPDTYFSVSVRVDSVSDLAGAEWWLAWDPTLLEAVNLTEVMFHEVTPESEWDNIWTLRHDMDNQNGKAIYAYSFHETETAINGGYCPISGNHTMAIIAFQVKGTGNCTFHFEQSILGSSQGKDMPHDAIDGFFSNSVPPPVPPPPPPPSEALFYVDPHRVRNESLIVNSIFNIVVNLDSTTNHSGIIAASFELTWDPTLLEAVNLTEVMFHEVTPESEWDNIALAPDINFDRINNTKGSLAYVHVFLDLERAIEGGYAPIFGNHTLAIITFKVKDIGKCKVQLTLCRAVDVKVNSLPYTAVDGFFDNTMRGDLNGDNIVSILDAMILANAYGTSPGNLDWNENADINQDGVVNILDVITLASNFGQHYP